MKRFLAMLLVLALLFSLVVPAAGTLSRDDEITRNPESSVYLERFDYVESSEFEPGRESEFSRDAQPLSLSSHATRGRVVTILLYATRPDLVANGHLPNIHFTDVGIERWDFLPILWGTHEGWVNGIGGGQFAPDRYITREEFITMLGRERNPPNSNQSLDHFSDANQISWWAVQHVQNAVAQGWLFGFPDGTFRPHERISRLDALNLVGRATGNWDRVRDPVPNTITWDSRGGSTVANWQRIPGIAIGPLPEPTHPNGTFLHWTRYGGRVTPSTTMTGNEAYIAQWQMNSMPGWSTANSLQVRVGPGTNHLPAGPNLQRRDQVTIVGESGDWWRISQPRTGYVSKDFIELRKLGWSTGNSVQVRIGAGTNYSSVHVLSAWDEVQIVGAREDGGLWNGSRHWWRVSYPRDGYVHSSLVQHTRQGWSHVNSLQIRMRPNSSAATDGTLNIGNPVTVIGESDCRAWWRIDRAGTSRYVNKGPANSLHIRWTQPGGGGGTPGNVTITWNAQGGVNPASWTRAPGTTLGTLPTPTWGIIRTNFHGWNTTNGRYAPGDAVTASTTVPNNNVTYYARWLDFGPGRRHLGYWYRSPTIRIRQMNLAEPWLGTLNIAMRNWNASATPIRVEFATSSQNTAAVQPRNPDFPQWLGSFSPGNHNPEGRLTSFRIRLYSHTIAEHATENGFSATNVAVSTWTHEIGHALGLADGAINQPLGGGRNNSIMNLGRDRNDVQTPRPFDQQSVNWLFR